MSIFKDWVEHSGIDEVITPLKRVGTIRSEIETVVRALVKVEEYDLASEYISKEVAGSMSAEVLKQMLQEAGMEDFLTKGYECDLSHAEKMLEGPFDIVKHGDYWWVTSNGFRVCAMVDISPPEEIAREIASLMEDGLKYRDLNK